MSDRIIEALKGTTPARIGVGRSGTRPRTEDWLRFRLDHALARDAVHSNLDEAFIVRLQQQYGCPTVRSLCRDRREYVLFPPRGKEIDDDMLSLIKAVCPEKRQIQIVISDGLSATAVHRNVPDLLPMLHAGLTNEDLSFGIPVIARYARVAIADKIAYALGAPIAINLIGERPGLSSSCSLSAYVTYNPGPQTISSDRTVVSNIHAGGTPPLEAGAFLAELCQRMLRLKASGVKLQKLDD